MKFFLVIFIFSLSCKIAYSVDCSVDEHNAESRVKKSLFCNGYDNTVRPVKDHKTMTNITLKMFVKSYDYSDYASTLTVNVWMKSSWKDEYLDWKPLEFDNLKSIDVPSSDVWRSDFSLYNADLSYGIGSCHDTNCLVESSGTVTCIEPCTYTAHCRSDYTLWPYDRQNCSMVFGPWMNNENEIDYESKGTYISTSGVTQNTEWRLVASSALKKTVTIASKDKAYSAKFPNMYYTFTIERHSAMIARIVGTACLIMVVLNLVSMFIDAELVERTVLLTFNVFIHFTLIHQLSWTLPHNGDSIPNSLLFYRNSLIITVILLFESIIVKSIYSCERPAFGWMQFSIGMIREKQLDFIFFKQRSDDTDENSLIEGEKVEVKPDVTVWKNFCNVLDRIVLVIFAVTYVIMCVTLVPSHYGRKLT